MTFQELTEEVRKLNALLQDPQHGLMTWNMMYGQCMQKIVKYWQEN